MRRRAFIALGCIIAAWPLVAPAQQISKQRRVGFLSLESEPASLESSNFGAFAKGMNELGYVQGKDLIIEWRFANGNYEQLSRMAIELVQMNVDAIVAATPNAVNAVRQATQTIPIVMCNVGDPVGDGFVASLAKPGGNITGQSNVSADVSIKYVELLKVVVPQMARVAMLVNPGQLDHHLKLLGQVRTAAQASGIQVFRVDAGNEAQIVAAFDTMSREQANALVVPGDPVFAIEARKIAGLAVDNRLPTVSSNRILPVAGGLMSYGVNLAEHYRRAAYYVDRILKGAKPGDLPIEQPTRLEFVLNMKTAMALGITVPALLLTFADEVIE